eukprot:c9648_g1_i7.p1 GENE.c9648_g1_i7~~c9648_g1_i7.p1  ORF type:complete len:164 (+),score=27.67 c9648_g1_i7:139-630(+)
MEADHSQWKRNGRANRVNLRKALAKSCGDYQEDRVSIVSIKEGSVVACFRIWIGELDLQTAEQTKLKIDSQLNNTQLVVDNMKLHGLLLHHQKIDLVHSELATHSEEKGIVDDDDDNDDDDDVLIQLDAVRCMERKSGTLVDEVKSTRLESVPSFCRRRGVRV